MRKKIFLSSPTSNGLEMEYIKDAFDTNWLAPLGPNVDAFEKEICEYTGAKYAVALSSGTAALHLGLVLAGVGQGDVVFCSDLTFVASANPIRYLGATPVFIDSEYETWNMSPEALEAAFLKYPKPKAVMLVHLYGTPAKINEIVRICDSHGVTLVEDSAEALGSLYKGRAPGTFGSSGVYSFNGNKIITTTGGGMLVTNDAETARHCHFLSTQAKEPVRHYLHKELGYNYRLSNICAGFGRGQLKTIDEFVERKRNIYAHYQSTIGSIDGVKMNPMPDDCRPNCWLSVMDISDAAGVTPDDVINTLAHLNIESRPVWMPMHMQPLYGDADFISVSDGQPVSEILFRHGVCLPSDIKMTRSDLLLISDAVRSLFDK